MVTLVVGASGLVGFEFYRQNQEKPDWHFTYHSHQMDDFIRLDATDEAQVRSLIGKLKPSLLILPAAMANVNRCEKERDIAWKNNVGIVQNFLKVLDKACTIVFFSTDYLFDGKEGPYSEDAPPRPLNYYGQLKLECERAIEQSGHPYLIIRTTGIFGWEMQRKNFMYRVLDTLGSGKELVIPNDQWANPVYVKDLVGAVLQLLEKKQAGIFHVSGPEWMPRDKLAHIFASFFRLDESKIVARPTSFFQDTASRPLKGGLKIDKILALGIKPRTVQNALMDLVVHKNEEDRYPAPGKLVSLEELQALRAQFRKENKTVVLTNGVFDLLHPGHVQSLTQAKAQGDILVVALNSDASTKKIKGPSRPILTQLERSSMLAALSVVDYVVVFDETTPEHLIALLQPDIHVKGADWKGKKLPESGILESYGGRTVFIDSGQSLTTTKLIEKIRKAYGEKA